MIATARIAHITITAIRIRAVTILSERERKFDVSIIVAMNIELPHACR
jgi:hypothetical protein